MTHLTSDEFVDAVDGTLTPLRQAHLDACEPCGQQVAELASLLQETRDIVVPEPSPLYWQHLSARVRTAIDAEPRAASGWSSWLRWPVLAPIAALALVVAALVVSVPRPASIAPSAAVNDVGEVVNDVVEVPARDSFAVVADLVGDLDWDTAASAGLVVRPGAADRAVLELTTSEQQELTRLLHAELTRAKS